MAKKKTKKQLEIEADAIALVDEERVRWEEAEVWVTEKVAFRMRDLIRTLRKNYWGVFDQPKDAVTGRDKVWIGLFMSTVETWVKNTDLDFKDLGFIARTPDGVNIAEITRLAVREYLSRMYFGETLDETNRQLLIDGTHVWKTWETKDGGKAKLNQRSVDLLNFYIDPTAQSISQAVRVTERAVVVPSSLRSMTGWKDTDFTEGSNGLSQSDARLNNMNLTTVDYVDVWETWGLIPRYLVEGDKDAENAYELIEGHIVVSGLEGGAKRVHLIEKNTKRDKYGNPLRPYEEVRCAKVANRWYGIGPGERILALQEYMNIIANTRLTRSTISQMGLFKIRKGSGITPQALAKLPVNGAIPVTQENDVTQLAVSDVPMSSYKDEDVIKYWAQSISGAQPITAGEILPSSATATSAAITNTNAKSGYIMYQEGYGMFIQRWMDRQALPIISKTISTGQIYRIAKDDESFEELAERIACFKVEKALEGSAVVPSMTELKNAIESEKQQILNRGSEFVELTREIIADSLEATVKITNEDVDTAVAINNIIQMANIPVTPQNINQIKMVYDLMGLPSPKIPVPEMGMQEGVGNGVAESSPEGMTDINARNMTGGIATGAQNMV